MGLRHEGKSTIQRRHRQMVQIQKDVKNCNLFYTETFQGCALLPIWTQQKVDRNGSNREQQMESGTEGEWQQSMQIQ